jgi:Concanavalin A-like lectin/glucanases superfamily
MAGSGGSADAAGSSSDTAGKAPTAGTTVAPSGGTMALPAGGKSSSAGAAGTGGVTAGTSSGGSAGSGGAAGSGGSAGSAAGSGGSGGSTVKDDCPNDPAKTAPGTCGCGFPDADTAQLASCTGLKTALAHRYDFEGTGTVVTDRVGTSHGSVEGGASLSQVGGKGAVVLAGGAAGSYVDLPNGLVSALTNATLEAWVTWGGGAAWQRIFDFGDSTNATPEDNPANGKSYLFVTPTTDAGATGVMRAVYSLSGGAAAAETRVNASVALAQVLTQVALVVDSAGGKLILYMDGKSVGEQAFAGDLGSINDVNCWLGRSQYNADPEMTGTFHDFRIYDAALSPLQIATSFAGGADPAFLAK